MRVMFNSGYELGALYLDGNVEEHAASMASTIWSTMDPITGNSNNKLSAVMPTALRPWVEVNYLNRNYNDIPILPEEYGAKQNDYLRYYERTNDLYKDIAKNMYFKSGETIDVSPETLEYIVSDATGGIISTGFKTYEMVDALFKGTEVDKNKIPFYSKFVVDMKQQEYRYSKDFYEIYDVRGKSVINQIRLDNAIKYAKEGNAIRKSKGQPDLVKDLEKKITKEITKQVSKKSVFKLSKEERDAKKKDLLEQWKNINNKKDGPIKQGIGITDEHIKIAVKLGSIYFADGYSNFKEWSKKIMEDLGLSESQAKNIWDKEEVEKS